MEQILIGVILLFSLLTIAAFAYHGRVKHKKDRIIYELTKKSDDFSVYVQQTRAENHNLKVKLAAEEAKKKTLTVDALQAIENLRAGGAILRIEVIDPGSMFMWSPSDKG
jgi:hypothetical protein